MIPVGQTRFYEGPEQRGSCVQACVASVFEIPEQMAPTQRDVASWTSLHYPGVACVSRDTPEPTLEPPLLPTPRMMYWLATVHTQTEGFTDPCNRCWEYEGNEHGPPIRGAARPCPWCGEQWGLDKGTRPGYHCIVMHGHNVAHDPGRDVDWDADRWYCGAAWWAVTDPARLEPRRLPR